MVDKISDAIDGSKSGFFSRYSIYSLMFKN